MPTLNGLIHSRKFWLAVFAVVQALVFHFVDVPEEVWQTIAALVMVLIGAIAYEDGAEKRSEPVYEEEIYIEDTGNGHHGTH